MSAAGDLKPGAGIVELVEDGVDVSGGRLLRGEGGRHGEKGGQTRAGARRWRNGTRSSGSLGLLQEVPVREGSRRVGETHILRRFRR